MSSTGGSYENKLKSNLESRNAAADLGIGGRGLIKNKFWSHGGAGHIATGAGLESYANVNPLKNFEEAKFASKSHGLIVSYAANTH